MDYHWVYNYINSGICNRWSASKNIDFSWGFKWFDFTHYARKFVNSGLQKKVSLGIIIIHFG